VNQVQELEQAILARAERLATEYRERAQRNRDNILRDAAERLRLREQREEAIAKALGERTFRQQVQANELKMQSLLDRVRWNLVIDIEQRLRDRMRAHIEDEAAYLDTLRRYVGQAATEIETDDLLAEVNARDHRLLTPNWEAMVHEVAPGKTVRLAEQPIETLGGVRITSRDGRIRVDNTFEGRLERLRPKVQQVILERLLPSSPETGNVFSG
jgi:V/A-type H+-transporting ATPase subunit E